MSAGYPESICTSRNTFLFQAPGWIEQEKAGRILDGRIWNEIPKKFHENMRKDNQMAALFSISAGLTGPIVCFAIFMIVFIISLRSLAELDFPEASRFILAICVSLLAIIGMSQTFDFSAGSKAPTGQVEQVVSSPPEHKIDDSGERASERARGGWFDGLLIPYQALAITLIAGLFLLIALKIFGALRIFGRKEAVKKSPRRADPERSRSEVIDKRIRKSIDRHGIRETAKHDQSSFSKLD